MSKGTRFITALASLAVLGLATAAVAFAATIIGTPGPDRLTGTPDADQITRTHPRLPEDA